MASAVHHDDSIACQHIYKIATELTPEPPPELDLLRSVFGIDPAEAAPAPFRGPSVPPRHGPFGPRRFHRGRPQWCRFGVM